MSGMFDAKTDKANRKIALSQKEEKAKRKSRIITTTVISVLILFSVAALLINSGFIRRALPVVTIDGRNFTTAEFEYFFHSEHMEYVNMMSQFQGFGMDMPDPNRPLTAQIYNPSTGETWADFFQNSAFSRMSYLVSLTNAAAASGFTLSQDSINNIEEDIEMIEMQAIFNGFPSSDSLLQQMYGSSINVNIYREIMKFVSLAWTYNEHVRESFNYSPQQLSSYYTENRDDLDVFVFRMFTVVPEELDRLEFDSDEAYEEALEVAVNDAHERAGSIVLAGFDDADAFVAAAQDATGNTTSRAGEVQYVMGEDLDDETGSWLKDGTRSYGDIGLFNGDEGSRIVFFVTRDDNNYRTAGMKQILILRENVDPAEFDDFEDDPGYISAIEQAETALHERAEQVYAMFIAAGGTEDALMELMAEHSDDTSPGGEYSNISKYPYQSSYISIMKVVPEIEDWLFAEGRTVGDSELVYTEAYGFHLLYFTGFGELFFELMADDRMRIRDHSEWIDTLIPGVPVKRAAFILVHM